MTTYNTGNPVPSADARDRYDNSQTLDEVVNGDSESYSSRTGKQVISLGGMNSRFNNAQDERDADFNLSQEEKQESFQQFLDGSGWSSLGAYGAGVAITSHTQAVDYQGQPYQLKPSIPASLDAPYITTGAWATEGVNFKLVGDNSLRQDLAAPTGATLSGYKQKGAGTRAETADDRFNEVLSLANYTGFDATGATDTSSAWKAALAYIATKTRPDPTGLMSNPLNGYKLTVPPGDYLITDPSTLEMVFAGRVMGLTIESVGLSRIIYNPTTPGPLFKNNDKLLFLRVRGFLFVGMDSGSDFFSSTSSGGAQDYQFDDCIFHGSWRYGMNRLGTNTNSEFKWNGCSFSGTWKAWDYIAAGGTSDQFVNNWYTECKYWSRSPWIEYWKGGHIRMVTCDISGYSPDQLPAGEGADGNRTEYLIKLRGRTHGYGVCSLSVMGGRSEQKTQWAGLLHCEWGQGDITFECFDSGSQSSLAFAPDIQSVYFTPGNDHGPTIQWIQSYLIGKHVYISGQASVGSKRSRYESCTFTAVQYPDDAFIFTDPGSQIGRRSVVRLINCRGRDSAVGTFADADINWSKSMVGHTSKKMISLKSPTGSLPAVAQGSLQVVLPLNAVIIGVTIYVPAGASGSGATANYTVVTSEAAPTTLATLTLSPISAGGKVKEDLVFACDTREKSIIKLVPSANMNTSQGGNSFCTIEYIG